MANRKVVRADILKAFLKSQRDGAKAKLDAAKAGNLPKDRYLGQHQAFQIACWAIEDYIERSIDDPGRGILTYKVKADD
jgi:hypothetical protein